MSNYSSYSLNNIDILMMEYLNYENGFFIESGANDGLSQSNTALYEFEFLWKGLLVEPNKKKFFECKKRRKNSIVENYALVSSNYQSDCISGNFSTLDYSESLMSMVIDDGDYTDDHLKFHRNEKIENFEIVDVPAITIEKLIQKHRISKIDFFSLDVEGYELSVLNGLDFNNIRPKYFLIETSNNSKYQKLIGNYMKEKNYNFVKRLTGNDDLFIDNTID